MVMDARRGARHYIGYVDESRARDALVLRMSQHRASRGSRFLAAANEKGIRWRLAAVYKGGQDVERRLKNSANSSRICPLCDLKIAANARADGQAHRLSLGVPIYVAGLQISRDLAESLRRVGRSDLLPALVPYT